MTSAHDKCFDLAQTNDKVFAPSKYQLINPSQKSSINKFAAIDLGSQQIVSPKSTAKPLGIFLDLQLTWEPRVEYIRNKAIKILGASA